MSKTLKATLAGLLGYGIYGFSFFFTKVALNNCTPFIMLAVRFTLAFFILSRFFSKKSLISRIEKQYDKPFGSTEYCACVCGSYRSREILPTSVYEEYTELEFEGRSFMALKNYDAYLTAIYGDYMTLPPKEKQVSHHSFTAYYKEENND